MMKLNRIIQETDIRLLVYAPPIIGFIGFLIGMFVMNLLTNGHPYQPVTDILSGILSSLLCFSGYSQIYKKELPGPLGGIYEGNWAVVSGVFIILVFGFLGAIALIHGIGTLLDIVF